MPKLLDPKKILVFNSALILVAITRSVRAAAELTNGNAQSISSVCVGKKISSGGYYYRHIHKSIEIELSDLGSLNIKDYDQMCGEIRRYHSSKYLPNKKTLEFKNKGSRWA
ncbi:MAG: hypothetical protein ACRDD8_05885 [Bacteroidales bacterium]